MKTLVALLLLSLPLAGTTLAADNEEIDVYKSPTCGCCTGWVKYLEKNGFKVKAYNTDQLNDIKAKLGLTDGRLMSCHTAVIDGYVVEGHVPAEDIKRLLSERPEIAGITAPGMPQLSPGMHSETPKGYDVLSFDNDGNIEVYSSY
jgi:hypothetical protein